MNALGCSFFIDALLHVGFRFMEDLIFSVENKVLVDWGLKMICNLYSSENCKKGFLINRWNLKASYPFDFCLNFSSVALEFGLITSKAQCIFLHDVLSDLSKSFVWGNDFLLGNCDNMLLDSIIESDGWLIDLDNEVSISQSLSFLIDSLANIGQSEVIFWGPQKVLC